MNRLLTEKKEFTILVGHINDAWMAKKKRKYPFVNKDFGMLKSLMKLFTLSELLAMFDCYMARSPYWGSTTGYLISGFYNERSILLDDPNFKRLTALYETGLGMINHALVTASLGL